MKATRLSILLAVAVGLGGVCYLAVRHYDDTVTWRSYCFNLLEMRDPCRPKGLQGAVISALPSDVALQQRIAGSWWHSLPTFDPGSYDVSRITIASNGDYVCDLVFRDGGATHTNTLEGRWQVRDGLLIDTITKCSPPAQALPSVFSNRIVRVNDHELVYRRCRDDIVELWRRVKQVTR